MPNIVNNQPDIVDIDLRPIAKKKIRIDGDNSRILELNTSDLTILNRLREVYPKLAETANEAFSQLPEVSVTDDYDFTTDAATKQLIDALDNADAKMRELMDYIFQSGVSAICAPDGSMYDPINGQFRFEFIIDTLAKLYERDISAEMGKITKRVSKHTGKYTRGK